MAWSSPEYFAAGDAELDLTARILSDGLSARLNKTLVYDKELCTSVSSFQNSGEIASAFVVIATARPGASLPEVEATIGDEIARLAKSGPTPAELQRAKTKQEFDFISGLERIGGFGGKADILNKYHTFLGDPGKLEEDLGRYRKATAADVQQAVVRWLDTSNRLLIRFHAELSGRAAAPIDRTQEPPLGADRPFHAPEVKQAKLENGLEILVVERSDLPKVAVTLATRAGAAADPAGKAGVASLTAATIDLGTKTRKALEIEDALGDLGTSLAAGAGRETTSLSLEVLKRNLAPALAIVADVVRNPAFPASEVERERKRQLDALAQQARNANAVAARVRAMLAFGPEHPYGRPVQGLPATVEPIRREDLAAFQAARYRPAGSALIFVGALTLDEAVALAKRSFGDWAGAAPAAVEIPPPAPASRGRIYLVDRQDAAQTAVTQFLLAPTRKGEDFYALQLADAVWGGGGFGTRLNLNLREDKGYSYGVFSNLQSLSEHGLWYAGGGVQTNKTKESLFEFDKELKDFAGARPISEAEFQAAKVRKIRGYAQQFEAYSRVAEEIAQLWALGLPMSELQRENDEAERATLEATRAAAKKYARPEASAVLVVGDRAKIQAGIEELKLGEVVVLDEEGRPAS
jgi:zinc protease